MNDKAMDALANWRGEVHLGAATNEADELQRYRATGLTPEEIEVCGKRIVELRANSERLEVEYRYKQDECEKLQAENARLRAERDKAVEDLNLTANCDVCKHYDADEISCAKPTVDSYSCFEWRGPQEEHNAGN